MDKTGLHLFETAFGVAGLAWRESRVLAVRFPEDDADAVRTALRRRTSAAEEIPPPPAIQNLCSEIADLFTGGRPDFSIVDIDDDDLPEFDKGVWALTRKIPNGEIRTYGDIARALGDVAYSQRVGQALGRKSLSDYRALSPGRRCGRRHDRLFPPRAVLRRNGDFLKLEGALASGVV